MLAAGTGLAPMVPILQSITDDEDDETFVTLVGRLLQDLRGHLPEDLLPGTGQVLERANLLCPQSGEPRVGTSPLTNCIPFVLS